MYICRDCGSLFSAPEYIKRKTPVCPDCGSKNFTDAEYCKVCHSYFIADGYTEYCPECIEKAEDQLREAVIQRVDPDYIELLRTEYDDLDYIMRNGSEPTESPDLYLGDPELPEEHA